MTSTALVPAQRSNSERLFQLLARVDYKIVSTDADREAIFKLRYDAYTREEGILPRFDRRLSDHYDDLDNTTIFALFIDGELASTIRVSIVTSEFPDCPAMEVFPDHLNRELSAGKVLIDPTRHATNDALSRAFPGLLPFMTIRLPWMMADYIGADIILATVRSEHRPFYRRTFNCQTIGEPRYYPTLQKPHYLMFCDFESEREAVQQRYPSFRSSAFERRMLLENQGLSATLVPKVRPPQYEIPAEAAIA